jgi:hypothetical protein
MPYNFCLWYYDRMNEKMDKQDIFIYGMNTPSWQTPFWIK